MLRSDESHQAITTEVSDRNNHLDQRQSRRAEGGHLEAAELGPARAVSGLAGQLSDTWGFGALPRMLVVGLTTVMAIGLVRPVDVATLQAPITQA